VLELEGEQAVTESLQRGGAARRRFGACVVELVLTAPSEEPGSIARMSVKSPIARVLSAPSSFLTPLKKFSADDKPQRGSAE
jgi:hypothetical protein